MNKILRKILCGWLMLWVIGLPLVHVHPESDHAHGVTGHLHGGTFHTVLSDAPICAYEHHRHHHDSFVHGEPVGSADSPSHPLHGLEHPAYGFSVLNASLNPLAKAEVGDGESHDSMNAVIAFGVFPSVSILPGFTCPRPFSLFVLHSPSPRAPPSVFL